MLATMLDFNPIMYLIDMEATVLFGFTLILLGVYINL